MPIIPHPPHELPPARDIVKQHLTDQHGAVAEELRGVAVDLLVALHMRHHELVGFDDLVTDEEHQPAYWAGRADKSYDRLEGNLRRLEPLDGPLTGRLAARYATRLTFGFLVRHEPPHQEPRP